MEKENINGKVEKNMKVIGRMAICMEMELCIMQMEQPKPDTGKMVNIQVSDIFSP